MTRLFHEWRLWTANLSSFGVRQAANLMAAVCKVPQSKIEFKANGASEPLSSLSGSLIDFHQVKNASLEVEGQGGRLRLDISHRRSKPHSVLGLSIDAGLGSRDLLTEAALEISLHPIGIWFGCLRINIESGDLRLDRNDFLHDLHPRSGAFVVEIPFRPEAIILDDSDLALIAPNGDYAQLLTQQGISFRDLHARRQSRMFIIALEPDSSLPPGMVLPEMAPTKADVPDGSRRPNTQRAEAISIVSDALDWNFEFQWDGRESSADEPERAIGGLLAEMMYTDFDGVIHQADIVRSSDSRAEIYIDLGSADVGKIGEFMGEFLLRQARSNMRIVQRNDAAR
jgi:hypothetical protein